MMTDYSIRRAKAEDRDALTDLCLRSKQSNGYDDDFMAQCTEELTVRDSWITGTEFWLAEDSSGKLAGCIRLSVEEDGATGELETCFIDPSCQGKGVGRALFDELHAQANSLKLERIGLDADPFAEPFYARMGFKTVGRTPSGSIPGRTLPRMELELQRGRASA
ncbi:GNAT family N-acetyltransferase [Roseibium porphyridii]|uniref:GNAT family N-acetyltransferase n=1 Tax=Roseibium porphyridii TaxID=2866279 RepID=A0ABY8F8C3_9HYPH|nr:GNAT family N-acetyltransferase [Roseibium sp. KMA01]WFE91702.1 GNAT family N-acetyltransferase [Roseibium sp. KMA01]